MSNSFLLVASPSFSASTKASDTAIIEMPRIMLLQTLAACSRCPSRPRETIGLAHDFKDRLLPRAMHASSGSPTMNSQACPPLHRRHHRGYRRHRSLRDPASQQRRQTHARRLDVDGRTVDQHRALRHASRQRRRRPDKASGHASPPAAWSRRSRHPCKRRRRTWAVAIPLVGGERSDFALAAISKPAT